MLSRGHCKAVFRPGALLDNGRERIVGGTVDFVIARQSCEGAFGPLRRGYAWQSRQQGGGSPSGALTVEVQ
jgi:hypothetical protein